MGSAGGAGLGLAIRPGECRLVVIAPVESADRCGKLILRPGHPCKQPSRPNHNTTLNSANRMAVQLQHAPLTPAQAAQIPSRSLPLAPQLVQLLNELQSISIQLFSAQSSLSPAPLQPIYFQILALDARLRALLHLVADHAQRQQRLNSLLGSLTTLESSHHSTLQSLHASASALKPIVASGALDRAAIAAAAEATLEPATVLGYAKLLAPFTSAPPSSVFGEEGRKAVQDPSGRSLPEGALPPFPTEQVMRQGRLQFGRFGDEGAEDGMGQTGEVGGQSGDPCGESVKVVGRGADLCWLDSQPGWTSGQKTRIGRPTSPPTPSSNARPTVRPRLRQRKPSTSTSTSTRIYSRFMGCLATSITSAAFVSVDRTPGRAT